mmetsp:Transcript_8086/g.12375  ORF Transcript_8086/g.12375 Transcript_8086/m.12375 type:complete len:478 (-) Transcript_8086:230-1663(-)|eukprot:CAMPEP_0195300668 /NCGR_PEP_ID=MMETSP0707-20130614/27890_1 /TAXON_ID=33640 /ORGANISM="Asterionellopsis glacialis, Strain CCMP134" /LENGTH=477 /DNA_ID=CAMNT_0040363423 /DNA_START=145 /DNA_END=1578 /DNA_ORIENTATION=+
MLTPAENERSILSFPFQSPTLHQSGLSSDSQLRRRSWVVAMDRVRRERREETERQNAESTDHQMMTHLDRNADLILPSEQLLANAGTALHQQSHSNLREEEINQHNFHHNHPRLPSNTSAISARRPMLRLRPTQQLESNICLACGRTMVETPRSGASARRFSIPPPVTDCPCRQHQRSFEDILYNDTSNELEFLSPSNSDRFVLRLPNTGSQEDSDMGGTSFSAQQMMQSPSNYVHEDEARHKIHLRPKRRHSDPFTSPTLRAMDETMDEDGSEESSIDESPFSLDEELESYNKKTSSSKSTTTADCLPGPPIYSVDSMEADLSIDNMSRHSTTSTNNLDYATPNNYQHLLSRTPARNYQRVQVSQNCDKAQLLQPGFIPIHANREKNTSKAPLLPFMTPESVRPVTGLPDLQALGPQRGEDEENDEADDDIIGPPPPPFNGSASINFCYDGSATDLKTPVQPKRTAMPEFPMFTPN